MKDLNSYVIEFRDLLGKLQNQKKAKKEKAYLKSPYDFYGVSVLDINAIIKSFRKKHPTLDKDSLFKICQILWKSNFHEEKTLAVKLLEAYDSYLSLKDMNMLEKMLEECTGWDHVDEIACHLVSAILKKNKKAFSFLKIWSNSENFWMKRSSLISQILLFREQKGDKELFFEIAQRLIFEKEFFIRKAIGWSLREMSKTDPESVLEFIKKYQDKMSGLTFKEGSRKLPQQLRKQL